MTGMIAIIGMIANLDLKAIPDNTVMNDNTGNIVKTGLAGVICMIAVVVMIEMFVITEIFVIIDIHAMIAVASILDIAAIITVIVNISGIADDAISAIIALITFVFIHGITGNNVCVVTLDENGMIIGSSTIDKRSMTSDIDMVFDAANIVLIFNFAMIFIHSIKSVNFNIVMSYLI
jgi:hypothetical protein